MILIEDPQSFDLPEWERHLERLLELQGADEDVQDALNTARSTIAILKGERSPELSDAQKAHLRDKLPGIGL